MSWEVEPNRRTLRIVREGDKYRIPGSFFEESREGLVFVSTMPHTVSDVKSIAWDAVEFVESEGFVKTSHYVTLGPMYETVAVLGVPTRGQPVTVTWDVTKYLDQITHVDWINLSEAFVPWNGSNPWAYTSTGTQSGALPAVPRGSMVLTIPAGASTTIAYTMAFNFNNAVLPVFWSAIFYVK